jgi:hypothetical protein
MDQATANKLAQLIEPILNAALKEHGFQTKVKAGTYTDLTCRHTVIFMPIGLDQHQIDFERWAPYFQLKPTDRNRVVKSGDKKFHVLALRSPGRKMPVIGKGVDDGRLYDLPAKCLDQLRNGG